MASWPCRGGENPQIAPFSFGEQPPGHRQLLRWAPRGHRVLPPGSLGPQSPLMLPNGHILEFLVPPWEQGAGSSQRDPNPGQAAHGEPALPAPGLLIPRVTPASCRQQPAANWICLKQELSLQDENNARSSSSSPPGGSHSPPKPHHVVAAPAAPQAGS